MLSDRFCRTEITEKLLSDQEDEMGYGAHPWRLAEPENDLGYVAVFFLPMLLRISLARQYLLTGLVSLIGRT
jgi:hypothetical protein